MKLLTLGTALASVASGETALTVYNRNLAVVRETIPLELKAGENPVRFDRATAEIGRRSLHRNLSHLLGSNGSRSTSRFQMNSTALIAS